jgi:peptidoglycan glycosyltransferase
VNRQISQLALVALVLLASLIVATTYWQTWASAGLADRQDNEIQRVAQFSIDRGLIYAANGKTVLAANVRKKIGGQTLYFRTYPTHGLASQVVGYSTQSRSRAGVERAENSYLTASNADLGTILDTVGDRLKGTTIKGNSLVLTLRPKAQRLAEQLLRGSCGAAVLLNPKTGAVYAMASSPGYDPNLIESPSGYAKITATKSPCAPEPAAPLLNRATQGLFPPGSTFKTITAAAALDDGVYQPDSTFDDPGYCTEYGKQVHNALDQNGPEAFGIVNLVEAYQHSINAVFCNIGQKLGAKRMLDEAKKFGFYSVPPLETPSDSRAPSGLYINGKLFDPSSPREFSRVDPGRLAFGQDRMLTTPLQMAMVAAAVANGGVEMKPTLVQKVLSPGGSVIKRLHPTVLRRATKPSTAGALKNMMVEVVQAGTGTAAQIPGVVVAGKTGTAETCACNTLYDAWFIFFAPADDPVVAGAVVVEHQLNGFGGAIAAPIAKQLMQAILPPTPNESVGSVGH